MNRKTWREAMDEAYDLASRYQLPFRVYSIRDADGRWSYDVAPVPVVPRR